MFSLIEKAAKLNNVNLRTELHGDGHRLAVDLSISTKGSNDVLSEFDPQLKAALYRAPDETDSQKDLLGDQPGHLPKLKFPPLSALKWGWNCTGYSATVHCGISGKMNILLIECEIDKFRFECQDGGTVLTSFRIIAHPTAEEVGRLSEMIQQEITLSLTAPTPDEIFQKTIKKAKEGAEA